VADEWRYIGVGEGDVVGQEAVIADGTERREDANGRLRRR